MVCLCIQLLSCTSENPCDGIICNNGGTCVDGTCACLDGFSGPNCDSEDLCITESIECFNGGVCENGACQCPTGFTGENCEEIDVNQLQFLLDEGIRSPLDLVAEGVAIDELYGLRFAGGLIFYIDVDDQLVDADGMVVSMSDVSNDAEIECQSEDVTAIENASYSNTNPGVFQSSGVLGQGENNTSAILDACGILEEGAATRCRNVGEGWFLPSMEEIYLIDIRLPNELALFSDFDYYWTSTESSAGFFWALNTGNRFDALGATSSFVHVRAVKAF